MKIKDMLFKPRQLPLWWVRFTDTNPVVPNAIAVAVLIWICFSLATIISASEMHGHGQFVETIGVVSQSEPIVEKAISLRSEYHHLVPEEVRTLLKNLYGNFALYLIVPLFMFLEFLFPCNPSQPLIGKGFLQDAIWYLLYTPLALIFVFPVLEILHSLFDQYLGFLSLGTRLAWPPYVQIIAALLLAELFIWFNHFVRHKILTLWHFHAVHHSQKELNIFTDDRTHIVDLLVGSLLTFIPFFIFDVSNLYAITIISIYKPLHNRFIHANIKINLGWLGLLVTSPQFHRVHHSVEPAHADKNYGVYFSFYDYLFGTACKSRNVYPETGIADASYPDEGKVRALQLPVNWLAQMVYPFVKVYEQIQASVNFNLSSFRVRLRGSRKERTGFD
jgi:sterol desaturase/sphingolipid hydroxylase (fatty acid hydroxylase superfamily)